MVKRAAGGSWVGLMLHGFDDVVKSRIELFVSDKDGSGVERGLSGQGGAVWALRRPRDVALVKVVINRSRVHGDL